MILVVFIILYIDDPATVPVGIIDVMDTTSASSIAALDANRRRADTLDLIDVQREFISRIPPAVLTRRARHLVLLGITEHAHRSTRLERTLRWQRLGIQDASWCAAMLAKWHQASGLAAMSRW